LLALCDAAGPRRNAAARLSACVGLLLQGGALAPRIQPLGCAPATGDELAVARAVSALQERRPLEAQSMLAAWLPAP
jgi:hypothetical protein